MNLKVYLKKYKKPLIIVGSVLLAFIITFIIKSSLANPNQGYLKNQTIDGLSFENARLDYQDGITTFTAEVYNESESSYNLKTINITLSNDKKEENTLVGYIGEVMDVGESKLITASIDKDLTDSVSLKYEIVK